MNAHDDFRALAHDVGAFLNRYRATLPQEAMAESYELHNRLNNIAWSALAAPNEAGADSVLSVILAEVARATVKFPTWPTDPLHAVAVLGEEFGELTKATLQSVYEPHKGGDVRMEAIQTAAMAARFVASLDRYEYTQCPQHAQGEAA